MVNFFSHIFAVFAFLTLGSLLLIVSFHILSLDSALTQLQELYSSPWHSFQTGMVGLVFISVGLSFARMLIKKKRDAEALIIDGEMGPIVVSLTAIEDVVKKVLKRFHLVKDWKVKTTIKNKDVEIGLRLSLWSGTNIQDLLLEIQEEIRMRLVKMVGQESRIEIVCDVQRIEDPDTKFEDFNQKQAAL